MMIGPLAAPAGGVNNTHAESVRHLLRQAKKSLRCEICGTTKMKDGKRKLSQCSRCQMVDYCCRRHQKIDWPFHKLFCGRDQEQVLEKFSDLQRDVNNKDTNFFFSDCRSNQSVVQPIFDNQKNCTRSNEFTAAFFECSFTRC